MHYIRQRDAIKKQQAGLILIGLSFPLLAGVLGYSLLPSLGINVPELSVFGFVIGTGTFTGYAIWKYQLFDVTPATAAEMIIATMPGALLLVDAQGNILTANEPALRMLGYGKQSLIGQSVNKVLANDMNPPEIQTSDISGKDFQDTETRLLAKSGEMVPVSLSKASMKDASGHLVGAVLIAHDITERKSAEQTLQMRDEEFRALVEHTSDMVIRFDLGRRITYMNSACRKALNIAANEFLGMTCGQSGLPAGLTNVWDKAVRRVIETGAERKMEHELPNSGGVINYDTRLTPEFSEDGSIESVLVVTRDITEHVNAEKTLAETENLYRHIFNQSTDVLVHLDRNSRILDVNRRALEITGLKKKELVGKKISALAGIFTKSSIARMVKAFAKRMVGAAVPPYEVEVHTADGRLMFLNQLRRT